MTGKILVVGSINMDLVVQSPHLPRPGETVLGGAFGTFPGGKGANQAVAAARLGGDVAMLGRVGQDDFGKSMLATLAQDRVGVQAIGQDADAATGVALITVDAAGENTIVVASGANMRITPEEIDANESLFAGVDLLVLQLEVPLPAVRRAVELARRHGVRVILNPAPAQVLDAELLAGVDFLMPNEGELLRLSGESQPDAAVRRIRESGVKTLLVTLGDHGALLVEEGGQASIPAFKVKAVDTTAAGDSFVGAFAVALAEGKPVRDACVWASAAAAISVTRPGAQPSLPARQEVEDFLKEKAK